MGDRGALVGIVEWRPSVGGIIDHAGSNGAVPPDDAELLSPFPPYRRVLQCAHLPSVDGREDIARRDLSPECARWIKVCYPCTTPLAINGEGESQLAGGHDNHEWQRMWR